VTAASVLMIWPPAGRPIPATTRRYSWTEHRRRLHWRALMDVTGVLLCILIALLWVVQSQAGH